MSSLGWSLVETTAQLLQSDQREAVLGDLAEAGESAWQALLAILSLILRWQAALWRSWRPWLAAFGVSLPASLMLMGVSLSVTQSYQRVLTQNISQGALLTPSLLLLMAQVFLLIGWSWSSGFAVGSLSRKTIWISVLFCCSPCLFCLERFRVPSLSRFSLLLFLIPAILGARQGWHRSRFKLSAAVAFALTLTMLTIVSWNSSGREWWTPRVWVLETILIWPVWYLAANAYGQRRARREQVAP
jgi:hypothetical protein